ncbi:hypothetical protein [Exiguobacterium sp.]|uniref:hypothetical protein n=1 Tax=Exiguobacterium sp. TaxID=44751 RepID=UPI003918E33C
MKKGWIAAGLTCIVLMALHATPHGALRTYVCLTGHPVAAFTSPVTDDDPRNEESRGYVDSSNGTIYTLTEPPIERETQGRLESYFVRKVGPFYIAEHYGGG